MNAIIDVLVLDDDTEDVQLLQQAVEKYELACTLVTFLKTEDALAYLEQRRRDGEPLPDVILMDLNLRISSGHDALIFLKASHHYRRLPVIVLSGHSTPDDGRKSVSLGAAAHFVKPQRDEEWEPVFRTILEVVERRSLFNA